MAIINIAIYPANARALSGAIPVREQKRPFKRTI
nr:MAG TPA: hypothetical protein [Caudoviricetes sp.]